MDALKASLGQVKPPAKSRGKAPAAKPEEEPAAKATGTAGRPRRSPAKGKA
jgi:DNA end-binding protein Ku